MLLIIDWNGSLKVDPGEMIDACLSTTRERTITMASKYNYSLLIIIIELRMTDFVMIWCGILFDKTFRNATQLWRSSSSNILEIDMHHAACWLFFHLLLCGDFRFQFYLGEVWQGLSLSSIVYQMFLTQKLVRQKILYWSNLIKKTLSQSCTTRQSWALRS